ncbi:unnamed protein product [Hermetia illucens]|uniref:Uncharacterized protein n=1 Tax=Hermetia illucens TaxID=343691 RepID=A0A7R8UAQ8_HERIL|nr:unnamed protein product [Hermetia illucens]
MNNSWLEIVSKVLEGLQLNLVDTLDNMMQRKAKLNTYNFANGKKPSKVLLTQLQTEIHQQPSWNPEKFGISTQEKS